MPVTGKEKSGKRLPSFSNVAKHSKSSRKKKRSDKEDVHLLNRQIFDDLNELFHQMDVLHAHADKLKSSNIRSHDIDSFTSLLYEARSSLQPWMARFQTSASMQHPTTDDQSVNPSIGKASSMKAVEDNSLRSPCEPVVGGPSVSPSPLVSLHAKDLPGHGQQLFLLTPLPKTGVFKPKGVSTFTLKHTSRINSSVVELPTYENSHCGLLQRKANEMQGKKVSCPADSEEASNDFPVSAFPKKTLQLRVLSTPNPSTNQRCGTSYLMTPYLKMSPPKTCLLLEDISESHAPDGVRPSESTPLTVRVLQFDEPCVSKANGRDISTILSSKYPGIFQPTMTSKKAPLETELESSIDNFISPPKTCLLLCADKLSTDDGDINGVHCQPSVSDDVFECTPLTCGKAEEDAGKAPGEQTLKRELWAKFEAVSLHGSWVNLNCCENSSQTVSEHRQENISSE